MIYFLIIITISFLLAYRLSSSLLGGFYACMPPYKKNEHRPSWLLKHGGFIMACLVSLTVLVCALYVILSGKYDAGSQKWAFGTVGAIIGFWLRPGK